MTIPSDLAATFTGDTMIDHTHRNARPSRDDIARLAYQFYETHGRRDGHDIEDWLCAERELTHLSSIFET